jgi:hypothetical protein
VAVLVVRVVVVLVAGVAVAGTVMSAVRTFVVPRAVSVALSRLVFVVCWRLFRIGTGRKTPEALDRRLAFFAPTALLTLPTVWLTTMLTAFAGAYWAIDQEGVWDAIETSGSSLLTLGFRHPGSRPTTALSFLEAGVGLALLALLITYLPTIYGAFTRREAFVSLLEGRAGSPPWSVDLLIRSQLIGLLERADELFERAELWFSDIEESHTSLGALALFRSPDPHRSWVTASGTVLDTAAILQSSVRDYDSSAAQLTIRAGFLALRAVADYFKIPHEPEAPPDGPISVTRAEWDEVIDHLASIGVPIVDDRDEAWRHFSGWRVNYDAVLLGLAQYTMAPYAPWTSDRSPVLARSSRSWRPGRGSSPAA